MQDYRLKKVIRTGFWSRPLSLSLSRRLYVYVAAVPAAVLLVAVATMYWLHDGLEDAWRLGAIAMASLLMLSCVGSLLFNGQRYELRLSPLWAIVATAVLGWVYVDYGHSLWQIENRLHEQARIRTIDTCARHLHISHAACQNLLKTRTGRVLDTDDVIYRLQAQQGSNRPG